MTLQLSFLPPRLDPVDSPFLRQHDVILNVLRLDLVHPLLHGNKWFKLKYNVQYALDRQFPAILSFGGAYSNHLYALAAAGKYFGLRTIGLVRGELVEPLNPVLAFARQQGMELIAVNRSQYRRKTEPEFIAALHRQYGEHYLIPEGGSNELAVTGCAEIADLIQWQSGRTSRFVALACGTGTTLAGIVRGLDNSPRRIVPAVLGIGVVKAPGYLASAVQQWLPVRSGVRWSILEDYHGGGYAKQPDALRGFIREFAQISSVPLEPVYTGKLLQGLFDQIRRGLIAPGSEVIALHTGGIYS